MDRSHTTVYLREGTLRLAVPTEVFDKVVHRAEQQVALEEKTFGPISYIQRQLRVESLLWSHLWPKHPFPSDQKAMLERRFGQNNQRMAFPAQAPDLSRVSTPQSRMGEFRYDPFPAHQNNFPQSPLNHPRGFRLQSQFREPFPSQSLLPPISSGRPLSKETHEAYRSISNDCLSRRSSGTLNPFDRYAKPFSEMLQSHDFVQQQQKTNNTNQHRWTATSRPRQDAPPPRTSTRSSDQFNLLIDSRSQTRRRSLPTRRNSHAELYETCDKPEDTTFPRGIVKKRRCSIPRKAAMAASAAIARVSEMGLGSESDEADLKFPKRNWAQAVSAPMKEEEVEENTAAVYCVSQEAPCPIKEEESGENAVALYGVFQEASCPIKEEEEEKEEKEDQSDNQTWAQIAEGAWNRAQAMKQEKRASSFGKHELTGTFKLGRYAMKTKAEGDRMRMREVQSPKRVFDHDSRVIQTKQKSIDLASNVPVHMDHSKRHFSFSRSVGVKKEPWTNVEKAVEHRKSRRGSRGRGRRTGSGKH